MAHGLAQFVMYVYEHMRTTTLRIDILIMYNLLLENVYIPSGPPAPPNSLLGRIAVTRALASHRGPPVRISYKYKHIRYHVRRKTHRFVFVSPCKQLIHTISCLTCSTPAELWSQAQPACPVDRKMAHALRYIQCEEEA